MRNETRLVLASTSPRRDAILNQIGLDHVSVASEVDEKSIKITSPRAYARTLAVLKASSVAPKFKDSIVIGADTIVVLDGKVLGKPESEEHAASMLQNLSGRTHTVITALCVIDTKSNTRVVKLVSTRVKFRKLNSKAIKEYVRSGEPLDKAGAYGIQGKGAALVESICGDFYNVVGLPVPALMSILERLGALPRSA